MDDDDNKTHFVNSSGRKALASYVLKDDLPVNNSGVAPPFTKKKCNARYHTCTRIRNTDWSI